MANTRKRSISPEATPSAGQITDEETSTVSPSPRPSHSREKKPKKSKDKDFCGLIGKPIPASEALRRWPHRYDKKKVYTPNEKVWQLAARHYTKAMVDGQEINLYDDVYVQAEESKPNYIAKIVELFETVDNQPHFTARWYYRHADTAIKERILEEFPDLFDEKRVFYSDVSDDNHLDCLVSKIKILPNAPSVHLSDVPPFDFYCDMAYSLACSTFSSLRTDWSKEVEESCSTISSDSSCNGALTDTKSKFDEPMLIRKSQKVQMKLLDLYSGCGAMSTGLCHGAGKAGVELITGWAVDMNKHACESLRFNHPETKVRNESADDFLSLIKEWSELYKKYCLSEDKGSAVESEESDSENDETVDDSEEPSEEFEVDKLLEICYGDPIEDGKRGVYFKVQWKGYGPSYDSWEPIENLSNCTNKIGVFVADGYNSKLLPLPGDVDVVCGGPPCQGVSGFNRFRNKDNPLNDPKNQQLIVFMDIVEYLKPKYVLMENVTDLLKFVDGYLGRYAIGRLVSMNYQTRLGVMTAGRYGLPQYRMRAFFWGACSTEKLPQFPLPTHETDGRGVAPSDFEDNAVIHGKHDPDKFVQSTAVATEKAVTYKLGAALQLEHAVSDLPRIMNDESRDVRPYEEPAKSDFQKQIRLPKESVELHKAMLYDHIPLELSVDDLQRVQRIPKNKGANFRMLPGVLVGSDNVVYLDPKVKRELLPSGKPLVPDYAITFVKGKSKKPFGRLWWDEIVPTVVTRAEPHNQRILHPNQDRVLTIRENARIQGFPDHYKLFGPVKERYMQVGNAVAVPVGAALGYALGWASQGLADEKPLLQLPPNFSNISAP